MSYGTISAAAGHGGTALTALSPQPHTRGVQYPNETYTPTAVYDDGEAFVVLRYPPLTPAQAGSALTQLGIGTAKTANVTISLPGRDRTTMTSYNGQAIQPQLGSDADFDNPLYRTLVVVVRQLEAV